MKKTLFALAFLALASVASAQTAPTDTYRARIYNRTIPGLSTTYDIPASQVQCGQVRVNPPTGTVANPTTFRWQLQPTDTTDCVWTDPGTGPLFALPVSGTEYDATVSAINTAGESPESARSNPFTRPGSPPATLTNVRVTRS